MARLIITIDLDNAAFEDDRIGEIERILTDLAERLPPSGATSSPINLHDINGNWCGKAEITR